MSEFRVENSGNARTLRCRREEVEDECRIEVPSICRYRKEVSNGLGWSVMAHEILALSFGPT